MVSVVRLSLVITLGIAGLCYAPLKKQTSLNDLYVDFDLSMKKRSAQYTKKFSIPYNYKRLEILKNIYEHNNVPAVKARKNPSIPLILHHIWVGPKKLSKTYEQLMKEWTHFHPSWTHMFWTDSTVKTLKLRNQALYDAAKDPVEKANILRYEVLDKYGGVYVDIDTKPLRSFRPLHYRYDFYTGICPADCISLINNAIIGCSPGHPIIRACINNMPFYTRKRDRVGRNGALYFSHIFMKTVIEGTLGITIAFPATFFFPLDKNFKSNDLKTINKEAFCIHLWASGHEKELPTLLQES